MTEDEERLKNFLLCKMYLTNKEIESIPWWVVLLFFSFLILIIILMGVFIEHK